MNTFPKKLSKILENINLTMKENFIKPILITGTHRSGSTWFADMLSLAKNTEHIREPFNIGKKYYKFNKLAKYWYVYIPELDKNKSISAFQKILNRQTGKVYPRRTLQHWIRCPRKKRLIIKAPFSSFSSDWISNNFDIDVIVLIRHPAAFAASLKRLDWQFDFSHFIAQNELINELLFKYKNDIIKNPKEIIQQSILLWNTVYDVLDTYSKKNKKWFLYTHESISSDPLKHFKKIYDELNLNWNNKIEQQIYSYTSIQNSLNPKEGQVHKLKRDSRSNIKRWKNILTKNEIDEIYRGTKEIWCKFYDEESWA